MSGRVEGAGGNREVPPLAILGAFAEACLEEEGGPWGKHGFPHATEPEAREAAAVAGEIVHPAEVLEGVHA